MPSDVEIRSGSFEDQLRQATVALLAQTVGQEEAERRVARFEAMLLRIGARTAKAAPYKPLGTEPLLCSPATPARVGS